MQEQEQVRWKVVGVVSEKKEPETGQDKITAGGWGARVPVALPSLSSVSIRERRKRDLKCGMWFISLFLYLISTKERLQGGS